MRTKNKGGDVVALKVFEGKNIEARNKENETIRLFIESGFKLENSQYYTMVKCGGLSKKRPAKNNFIKKH